LSLLRPMPLCYVGVRTLLDWALDSLDPAVGELAVNSHHHSQMIASHLNSLRASSHRRVHLGIEPTEALGTAGAVGALRSWIDGRGVLIVNADTFHQCDLKSFANSWTGEHVRILTASPLPFGPRSSVVASLLPWRLASSLEASPSGLWERVWKQELAEDAIEAVHEAGPVIDCGTVHRYLQANLLWSGGESVIGAGAQVHGTVTRSVVWPGSIVGPHEHLVDAVRAESRTVYVR
ncbi:MAG: hypothetical protein WD029_03870, partial [Microthrixaceae bacterium]